VFYEPEALDVVAYDKTTGKPLLEAKSKNQGGKKVYELTKPLK
jgi:hypothetical protein